jgi:cytochrome-b5 reductase
VKILLTSAVILLAIERSLRFSRDHGPVEVFDAPRFTPFNIIKREVVSPTSIILTLRTANENAAQFNKDPYHECWKRGIWSVEVKQPELQIARSYTPLPPSETDCQSDIKLLVRKEHKGEMSGYISNLSVMSKMQLRGPHPEFDIPDEVRDIIFLAGGTGIAPALQAAHTLLERRPIENTPLPHIHIIWASRLRQDCKGGNSNDSKTQDAGQFGPVVRELERLKRSFPNCITVEYLVDEERTFINDKRIARWTAEHAQSDDADANSKLILVSGPEGFVNTVAGPKRWQDGKEQQGTLGGILGQVKTKGWKIWKL